MFPMVPYHNLAKLHKLMKADSPPPYNGLVEAYREVIPALIRQSKDANYHVRRPLPALPPEGEAPRTSQVVTSDAMADADGWVEVCDLDQLLPGDVLRFEHSRTVYVIYRTAIGQLFASDGICTHGSASLADGFLQGTVIECPKHNGRFDIRDGSVRRSPPCVALKTYEAREKDGKVLVNVASAHGKGATEAVPVHTFRVVSNVNVASFIKELVLAPDGGSPALTYRPGDYLQFEIPPYDGRPLADLDVAEPYAGIWREQHMGSASASDSERDSRTSAASHASTSGRTIAKTIRARRSRAVEWNAPE
jgi:Na+-transporting NADH:ubiquinone oxidoreductase subunit F